MRLLRVLSYCCADQPLPKHASSHSASQIDYISTGSVGSCGRLVSSQARSSVSSSNRCISPISRSSRLRNCAGGSSLSWQCLVAPEACAVRGTRGAATGAAGSGSGASVRPCARTRWPVPPAHRADSPTAGWDFRGPDHRRAGCVRFDQDVALTAHRLNLQALHADGGQFATQLTDVHIQAAISRV